jgi:hypothetical protein
MDGHRYRMMGYQGKGCTAKWVGYKKGVTLVRGAILKK